MKLSQQEIDELESLLYLGIGLTVLWGGVLIALIIALIHRIVYGY